jgi:hypothetical protein
MTEMTTVQAVDHRTAKLNAMCLYRGAAAQEPIAIYKDRVHPDLRAAPLSAAKEQRP